MTKPDTGLGGRDDERVEKKDPADEPAPKTLRSAAVSSADTTPAPVSSLVTLEQTVTPDGSPSSQRGGPDQPVTKIGTMTKWAAGTALFAAVTTIAVERSRPKTPRPAPVVMGNGNPGEGNSDSVPDPGSGGAGPPDTDAAPETVRSSSDIPSLDVRESSIGEDAGAAEAEKCTPDITADGRPVQEGTCVLVFALGEDTVYMARLEKARIMIDNFNYEVEVDYGAVRGIAGNKHPDFLVRGSEHFLKADMQLKGTIWVENTENGKTATVKSEEGETLLQTSWTNDIVLKEGEYRSFALESPDGEQPACAVRWNGEGPENDADVWLSMLGALAALGVARRSPKKESVKEAWSRIFRLNTGRRTGKREKKRLKRRRE